VTIFAGATVLWWNTVVGRWAKIGAKAFVTGTVPAGLVVHSNTAYSGEAVI
jgi:serine acetyltransferase